MIIELILAFFLLRYLKTKLSDGSRAKKWDRSVSIAIYAIIVLILVDILLPASPILTVFGHLVLFSIIGLIYKLPDFPSSRNIVLAILPFVLVCFYRELAKEFPILASGKNYIGALYLCSILWMIAMLVISNKQVKALQIEREKRAIEEEQNRATAARKAELEIMVAERTSELLAQKQELEHALAELRETQAQLIQKEKMASLGELTAGIAHEIQNPLNFVNNFAEVNKELIEELKEHLAAGTSYPGSFREAMVIAEDIKDNEEKIYLHGKRADAIVKGMLQHSRASSGKKEPTDINALADEYLRLSYHGLRARDKTFNATFKVELDPGIEKAEVIPEDIGRVLLNLFNNSFYSVNEKKKQCLPQGDYEPTVWISSKKLNSSLNITVRDNGLGIPQKVLDKIFQPFFTTKPAGHGTGLGLSLSYEIIKAHGGELKVETKEGEFAQFIITLPYK